MSYYTTPVSQKHQEELRRAQDLANKSGKRLAVVGLAFGTLGNSYIITGYDRAESTAQEMIENDRRYILVSIDYVDPR